MSSTVYPRGCGWERDVSTCAVRAPLLFVHAPTYVGVCERDYRDTNLDIKTATNINVLLITDKID